MPPVPVQRDRHPGVFGEALGGRHDMIDPPPGPEPHRDTFQRIGIFGGVEIPRLLPRPLAVDRGGFEPVAREFGHAAVVGQREIASAVEGQTVDMRVYELAARFAPLEGFVVKVAVAAVEVHPAPAEERRREAERAVAPDRVLAQTRIPVAREVLQYPPLTDRGENPGVRVEIHRGTGKMHLFDLRGRARKTQLPLCDAVAFLVDDGNGQAAVVAPHSAVRGRPKRRHIVGGKNMQISGAVAEAEFPRDFRRTDEQFAAPEFHRRGGAISAAPASRRTALRWIPPVSADCGCGRDCAPCGGS